MLSIFAARLPKIEATWTLVTKKSPWIYLNQRSTVPAVDPQTLHGPSSEPTRAPRKNGNCGTCKNEIRETKMKSCGTKMKSCGTKIKSRGTKMKSCGTKMKSCGIAVAPHPTRSGARRIESALYKPSKKNENSRHILHKSLISRTGCSGVFAARIVAPETARVPSCPATFSLTCPP